MNLVEAFRVELRALGVNTELTAMLSLLNANRLRAAYSSNQFGGGSDGLFDRQHVLLPDVQLLADKATPEALKPVFDLMAQACGLAGSPNYDKDGMRIVGR